MASEVIVIEFNEKTKEPPYLKQGEFRMYFGIA